MSKPLSVGDRVSFRLYNYWPLHTGIIERVIVKGRVKDYRVQYDGTPFFITLHRNEIKRRLK